MESSLLTMEKAFGTKRDILSLPLERWKVKLGLLDGKPMCN